MREIALAIIGSSAFTALVSGIVTYITTKRNAERGMEKAVQLLLLGEIKRQGKQFLKDGRISAEELEEFNAMYACYHNDLGGNGFADTIVEKVKKLPIEPDK